MKIGVARRRGVLAQSGAAHRGRRPGARRLYQAARGRPRRQRVRRRGHRSRQDARPGRGILAGRSAAHRRTAEPARQGLSRSVGVGGQAACRRRGAARRARPRRATSASPIRNGREPVLRFPQAGLSADRAAGPTHWSATPPTSIRTPGRRPNSTCGRSPTRCRRSNFVLTNPELLRETLTSQRRKSGARHAHARRGHRDRRRRPENPPVRRLDVRGRAQSGDHARQGDFPERADAAHPIRADRPRRCSSGRC